MHPFRVFLSYSHQDHRLVSCVESVLGEIGLVTVWDRKISPGSWFTDRIKEQIATAHIFMPILTRHSQTSPWVHQETGFAVGIDVPVLPIALGSLPAEMLAGIQAIHIEEDLSDLATKLQQVDFQALVLPSKFEPELQRIGITSEVANAPEERARILVSHSQNVPKLGIVRQRVIFSSFSIPTTETSDESWEDIDYPQRRSRFYRRLLRSEREIMEEHARQSGCQLILHPFGLSPSDVSSQRARLQNLIAFLSSIPSDKAKIAISKKGLEDSLIIVGDWFGARSLPPPYKSDYRQTIFCRHAPTVLRWISEFEREINDILAITGTTAESSRDAALSQLEERLQSLSVSGV